MHTKDEIQELAMNDEKIKAELEGKTVSESNRCSWQVSQHRCKLKMKEAAY